MQMSFVSRCGALGLVAGLAAACQTGGARDKTGAKDETLSDMAKDPRVNADYYSELPGQQGRMLSGAGEGMPLDVEGGTEPPPGVRTSTSVGAAGGVEEQRQQEAETVAPPPPAEAKHQAAQVEEQPQAGAETSKEFGATGAVGGCRADVVSLSSHAVGNPCETTADVMRQLGLSEAQMERVSRLSERTRR